jgi:hypothetical protein
VDRRDGSVMHMTPGTTGLEGRLDEVPFADVLRLLRASRQTGALHLRDDTIHVVVVLDADEVQLATTGEDGLRSAVVGGGLLGASEWDAVSAASEGGEPGSGLERLIAAGVDRDRLHARLYEHTVTTLFELLLPSAAEFAFVSDESHPFARRPGYPFADVLDDVNHRVAEWREIATSVPSTTIVLRRASRLPASSGPITLTPEEFELLGLLDGQRDVAALISTMGMSAFRVMTTLHHLKQIGAIAADVR